jgi:hypothetical protein
MTNIQLKKGSEGITRGIKNRSWCLPFFVLLIPWCFLCGAACMLSVDGIDQWRGVDLP